MESGNVLIRQVLNSISSKSSSDDFVNVYSSGISSAESYKGINRSESELSSAESYEIICENSNISGGKKTIHRSIKIEQKPNVDNDATRSIDLKITHFDKLLENNAYASSVCYDHLLHKDIEAKNGDHDRSSEVPTLEDTTIKDLRIQSGETGKYLQEYLKYLMQYHSIKNIKNCSKKKNESNLLPSAQIVINGSFGAPAPIMISNAQRFLILLERSFFCEYYCLITTGVSFLKTNDKSLPIFLKEFYGFYDDIPVYKAALQEFSYLIKNRQKFVLSVDFTKLSNKSQKAITNNLSGYTCIKSFLTFVPKKKMTSKQFNALVIAYQMAKSPYNWNLCGLTRSKKVTETYGSVNANSCDLFMKIGTHDQIKNTGPTFSKYSQKVKGTDNKFITWESWSEDFICSVDDIIIRRDASFYGWTDSVLRDCALSIRDQTFKLYGHLIIK